MFGSQNCVRRRAVLLRSCLQPRSQREPQWRREAKNLARTLRNTARASCYFLPLKAKPSLLTRMDLPMSSLSEDKGAGHGNTLEKEEKTVRGCRNDAGPLSEKFSRQIFGHELVETRLVFLPDSGGGHDAGLSPRLARGNFVV